MSKPVKLLVIALAAFGLLAIAAIETRRRVMLLQDGAPMVNPIREKLRAALSESDQWALQNQLALWADKRGTWWVERAAVQHDTINVVNVVGDRAMIHDHVTTEEIDDELYKIALRWQGAIEIKTGVQITTAARMTTFDGRRFYVTVHRVDENGQPIYRGF